jgi:hypothetical protein
MSNTSNCPDCDQVVSTRAAMCVHCGAPLSTIPEIGAAYLNGLPDIPNPPPPPPRAPRPRVCTGLAGAEYYKNDDGSLEPTVQTIERTGKRLKLHMVLSVLVMVCGVGVVVGSLITGHARAAFLTTPVVVCGVVWYFVTRVRTWWSHG